MIKKPGNEYLKEMRSLFSWPNALIAQCDHKIYSPERNNCKNKPFKKQTKNPKKPNFFFFIKETLNLKN